MSAPAVEALASQFLASAVIGRDESWQSAFQVWSRELKLTAEQARAVRIQVLRSRCFGDGEQSARAR